jgi:hypothetical protein
MSLAAEALPFQRADHFTIHTTRHAKLRRHDGDVDLPIRHIQQRRLSRRGPLDGNAGGVGAQSREQACEEGRHEIWGC